MNDPGYEVRGEKVKRLRIGRRFTQQKLAQMTGLSVGQISRIEGNRHTPRFGTVDALAEALGVEPEDLIEYSPLVA